MGKLVKAQLLKKLPDPDDARARKVTLTEKGVKLIQDMAPSLRAVNGRLFTNMSRRDMTILSDCSGRSSSRAAGW